MKPTMICCPESDGTFQRVTLTFDISKRDEFEMLAKLHKLASTKGAGIVMTDANTFYIGKVI